MSESNFKRNQIDESLEKFPPRRTILSLDDASNARSLNSRSFRSRLESRNNSRRGAFEIPAKRIRASRGIARCEGKRLYRLSAVSNRRRAGARVIFVRDSVLASKVVPRLWTKPRRSPPIPTGLWVNYARFFPRATILWKTDFRFSLLYNR